MKFFHSRTNKKLFYISLGFLSFGYLKELSATNLSIGADYFVRGVSIKERDNTLKSSHYYDQRLQAYLTTDLSKDVEASIRVQSITPWGLEGSTTPLATRYPDANGNLWVQHAYARLPHIWKDRIIVTVGRQPIVWGDGKILSDDELGFNAIRAQIKSPWRRLPFDLEGFTAKISEGLSQPGDRDLHGAMLTFDSKSFRWDLMGLFETADGSEMYEMGAETVPVTTSKIHRTIYGARAITRLRDAYLKGEYYIQKGDAKREPLSQDIKLSGYGYVIGVGGKQNTSRFGRFGAVLEYSVGSGDKPSTRGEDEAFRPSFQSRWSGLERKGYGRYFASTFSDAYSPGQPFAPVTSTNDGLPESISGIQSIRFGVDATPWSQWTFSFDFYQYKAQRSDTSKSEFGNSYNVGNKDLGTEFDYGFVYRYSGLVTVKGSTNKFSPGEAFNPDHRRSAEWSSLEVELKF